MAASGDIQVLNDMLKYKEIYNYSVFIETGTSNGESTRMFSKHFGKTYTCDNMVEEEEIRIEKSGCFSQFFCLPLMHRY
jgi:hypothetical protein